MDSLIGWWVCFCFCISESNLVKSYHNILMITLWIRHDLASCKRGPVIPVGFSSGVSRLILQQLDGAFARQQIQISCRTWGWKRQTQHISARICRFLILSCFSSHPFLLIRLSCRHSYYLSVLLLSCRVSAGQIFTCSVYYTLICLSYTSLLC